METLIHADIFFFVTTLIAIVLGVVLTVVLCYVAFILKDMKHISEKLREGSDNLAEDIAFLREGIKKEGVSLMHIGRFLSGIFKKRRGKR